MSRTPEECLGETSVRQRGRCCRAVSIRPEGRWVHCLNHEHAMLRTFVCEVIAVTRPALKALARPALRERIPYYCFRSMVVLRVRVATLGNIHQNPKVQSHNLACAYSASAEGASRSSYWNGRRCLIFKRTIGQAISTTPKIPELRPTHIVRMPSIHAP
jgi:hypothetical protein